MSIEAFQISTSSMLIDAAYSLLLSKKIVGNPKELEIQNDLLRLAKENLGASFLNAIVVSIVDGLMLTGIAIGMNYCLDNIYSFFFENTYWKEPVIDFATLQGASYILIAYRIYSAANRPLDIIEDSIETTIFIFIFQNYGLVTTFINLTIKNLLSVCRMRYMGW